MEDCPRIEWDGSLETGTRIVDVQHKFLIDIINDLADAINQKKVMISIGKIINLLKHYTEWHFGREEDCMERFQCPAYEVNKKAHGWFIETLESFQREFRETGGSEEIARRMYHELTQWLVQHIKKIDTQLEPCIHTD